jgi:hypothetical protein
MIEPHNEPTGDSLELSRQYYSGYVRGLEVAVEQLAQAVLNAQDRLRSGQVSLMHVELCMNPPKSPPSNATHCGDGHTANSEAQT